MNLCLILNGYQDRAVEPTDAETMGVAINTHKLLAVNFILILV